MTVVPSTTTLQPEDCALTLPRYSQLIEYSECQFFGIRNDADQTIACRTIWTKPERDMVAKYLAEAQEEIEAITGYPLHRRWFTDEQHPYLARIRLNWCKVVEAGIRAVFNISLGEAVDHTVDPAVVGPVATTVADEDEIHVYHPGTDVEIHPSSITISGGNVTILIPRCRMVLAALADNDPGGLEYTDIANFEAAVDVRRVYNDPSTNAMLVWPHGKLCCTGCGEETEAACITVRNGELGYVDVMRANYSGGTWTRACETCCSDPSYVRLNYRAGLSTLTRQAEDAIIRLAHAKMPFEPCKCDLAMRVWQRDRDVPEVLSRERYNCPFGQQAGAWTSWRFANAMRIHRGANL